MSKPKKASKSAPKKKASELDQLKAELEAIKAYFIKKGYDQEIANKVYLED